MAVLPRMNSRLAIVCLLSLALIATVAGTLSCSGSSTPT